MLEGKTTAETLLRESDEETVRNLINAANAQRIDVADRAVACCQILGQIIAAADEDLRADVAAGIGLLVGVCAGERHGRCREPTEADKNQAAYNSEKAALARLPHSMASGHTFVPHSDFAAREAMRMAEENGGELLSCWGIMPLTLTVNRDYCPCPGAKTIVAKYQIRVEIVCNWKIDELCWKRWGELFGAEFPVTLARIAESVRRHLEKAA